MKRWTGLQLKAIRDKRSQTSLAVGLQNRGYGTTQTQVSRWESGQKPHNYIVPDIAAELGCTVEELYETDDDEESDLDTVLTREAKAVIRATVRETLEQLELELA